ncbi:hypothetical protein C2S51_006105 [Perilla frutescens var. frutescens]|nr:hypothetical protein C2S51_006105 [Perilla frutescens var. frutescens]
MDSTIFSAIIFVISLLKIEGAPNNYNGLSFDYYSKTCPQIEKIVRDQMNNFTKADPNIPAHMLRLVFHDCQVKGCDGSVLLEIVDKKNETKMDSPKNFGITKRELIDEIKSKVEEVCPQKVSCADILVLAARDGIVISGGPDIRVPLGRKDTTIPHSRQEADVGLPRNNVNLTIALQVFFQEAQIDTEEERLYVDNKTLPPGNEAKFVEHLKKTCPIGGSNQFTTTLDLDPTPTVFDNKYYVNVLNGRGLISLDAEFARDSRTFEIVKKFARNKHAFFKAFSSAFLKLSAIGVLTGDQGIVRNKCSVLKSS